MCLVHKAMSFEAYVNKYYVQKWSHARKSYQNYGFLVYQTLDLVKFTIVYENLHFS